MFTNDGEDWLSPQRLTLNAREVAAAVGVSEHLVQAMTLEQVADQVTGSLLYRLLTVVYTQSLAPEVVPISLRTSVQATYREHECWQVPLRWTDYLRLRYPWLRRFLGEPRFVVVDYVSDVSTRSVPVEIHRDVVIEREFGYPDANIALPPDRFGQPVLYEFVRTPKGK